MQDNKVKSVEVPKIESVAVEPEITLDEIAKGYFHHKYDYNKIFSNPTQHGPAQLFMLERLDRIVELMEKILEKD